MLAVHPFRPLHSQQPQPSLLCPYLLGRVPRSRTCLCHPSICTGGWRWRDNLASTFGKFSIARMCGEGCGTMMSHEATLNTRHTKSSAGDKHPNREELQINFLNGHGNPSRTFVQVTHGRADLGFESDFFGCPPHPSRQSGAESECTRCSVCAESWPPSATSHPLPYPSLGRRGCRAWLGTIISHKHTRVGTGAHRTVRVTSHCPALNAEAFAQPSPPTRVYT